MCIYIYLNTQYVYIYRLYIHTYIRTYVRTYIHTDIHTYMHNTYVYCEQKLVALRASASPLLSAALSCCADRGGVGTNHS